MQTVPEGVRACVVTRGYTTRVLAALRALGDGKAQLGRVVRAARCGGSEDS